MKLMPFNLDVNFKKIILEKIKTLWTVLFILDPRSKIENEQHKLTPCPHASCLATVLSVLTKGQSRFSHVPKKLCFTLIILYNWHTYYFTSENKATQKSKG